MDNAIDSNLRSPLNCATNCHKLKDSVPTREAKISETNPSVLPNNKALSNQGVSDKKEGCNECVISMPCHWFYIGVTIIIAYVLLDKN